MKQTILSVSRELGMPFFLIWSQGKVLLPNLIIHIYIIRRETPDYPLKVNLRRIFFALQPGFQLLKTRCQWGPPFCKISFEKP